MQNIIQHKNNGQNENFEVTMGSYDGAFFLRAKYVYVINILATIIDKQGRD